MRKLIIVRGQPGSGKSTTIAKAGLKHYALSADALRATVAAPFLTTDARLIVNQEFNDVVFARMMQSGRERMARGETLVLDTTMSERGDLKTWLDLARRNRYQVLVWDFSNVPIELALQRNAERDEFERVPEFRVRAMHEALLSDPLEIPKGVSVVHWASDDSHVARVMDWLVEPIVDLSHRESIVHIGDLQGCFTVLAGPGGPLEMGLDPKAHYVFVGDLLDRGIENGKVMRWFLDNAIDRPNVTLLYGNHEAHLQRWANGEEAVSNEFALRTLPQLIESGITPEDAGRVIDMTKEFLCYRYRGKEVLVTHAGLPTFFDRPHLLSLQQYAFGTGTWSDPIDEQFERNSESGYQVHGHRNHGAVDVRATERSFNLEDAVEFGGNLRIATLDANGWRTSKHPNRVYRTHRERLMLETQKTRSREAEHAIIPHWMWLERPDRMVFEPDLLTAMRGHDGVVERSSERFPTVNSMNFTKAVFYSQAWDDVVVKARGLFFDVNTHEVCSRSFEKFWNIGERAESTIDAICETYAFPLKGHVKENGFLGTIGYHAASDSLFVSSKSTPDGKFADWFRAILDSKLDAGMQERLKRYLRDNEAAMAFEVIDPVNDPHMIEYDAPNIVLLDILRRSTTFERASYDVLKKVGKRFGLEVKSEPFVLKTPEAFRGWVARMRSDLDRTHAGKHVEGFVLEDANGIMTKLKMPFYAFWKQMRSQKDRILASRAKGTQFVAKPLHVRPDEPLLPGAQDLADSFLSWCLEQDDETLSKDIISLRNAHRQHRMQHEDAPSAMSL